MAEKEASKALLVEGVVKDFGEGSARSRVLRGVDMHVLPGELVALVGPSGSGKSTLLNVAGLLDRPTEGRVVIDGTDTTTLDEAGLTAFRGQKLGFIFQFHHLLPAFTALENVLLPGWGRGGAPGPEARERALALLRDVGLGDRASYRATKLSGGQAQRVAVARALLHEPALVLADEPTGNLDTESSTEVLALMRRYNRELRTAFLVVTHDPRIADACDRIVRIVDGRIVPP
jgi:lipoprotein-releasing system ATP-binding protein